MIQYKAIFSFQNQHFLELRPEYVMSQNRLFHVLFVDFRQTGDQSHLLDAWVQLKLTFEQNSNFNFNKGDVSEIRESVNPSLPT